MHGFMTAKGNPNYDRSARLILKDYVQGTLLYCHPPPATDPKSFQFLGRSSTGLPPSLANADPAKLAKFYQIKEKHHVTSQLRGDLTDPANLISEFDRLAFEKASQHRPHVRSRKQLLRPDLGVGDLSSDALETGSTMSSSSWVTTDTVGGSSLLSGTESIRSNWTASTATGTGTVQKKPWRLISHSKRLNTVRQDPFTVGECGAKGGQSRKRREKLRRVYSHLDQHEKT
ncbi:unnamed protein product [Echinostoma caproni]|uniref:Protein kinase domain-containing protein n=1 Tax=Echinostoma caproni TaxID=27848 RepID=A0A183AQV5_9TREM|nr:unnamed protein product [Echinostoma caproni]